MSDETRAGSCAGRAAFETTRSPREDTGSPATTALERTVLKARRRGVSHAEIGARLRRSPGFVARVEKFVALRAENSAES